MYQRYYDGYNEPTELQPEICSAPAPTSQNAVEIAAAQKPKSIFGSFEADDILLIGVLLLLLHENCDDKLMLVIIGFLFVSGL